MPRLEAGPSIPSADTGAARVARLFWPIVATLFLVRLLLDASCNLVPDEAFYWTWSRHLSTGYFDHPPMIAWLIWLSTRVLGNTELGVRCPASVLMFGSLAVLYGVSRQILHDRRAVGYVVLMWIAGPLLAVMGTIITPDAPATFFSVCALAIILVIADRVDRDDRAATTFLWIAFGLFCGLAFLSKYTTVLLPASVGLAVICSARLRRQLLTPGPYLAAIVSIAVFSPCIAWNARHQWASFLFQIHHGTGGGESEGLHGIGPKLLSVLSYLAGQTVLWTPVLFAVAVAVAIVKWGKFKQLSGVEQILLLAGTLPLLFFGLAATRSHGEINWPAFAYFPLSLLVGRYLTENWRGNRVQWVRKGCEVALGFTIAVHLLASSVVQKSMAKTGLHLTHQITDLWGWRDFGNQLSERAGHLPVVCNRHQDAGEAAFYMPGQPDVWCDGVGSRPTAFDYYDYGRPDLAHEPRVAFVGGHVALFMKKWRFNEILSTSEIIERGKGKKGKDRTHTVNIVGRTAAAPENQKSPGEGSR